MAEHKKQQLLLWAPHIAVACILIFTTALVLYKAYGPRPCERTRALFFVEAQGLRVDVSRLDICKKQHLKQLFTKNISMPALQQNFKQKGHWEVLTLERALQALRALRTETLVHRPEDFTGLVGSEFHKVANIEGFMAAARDMPELKLKIFLTPASDEASFFFNEVLWPRKLYL